ncbi:lysoplasmalogenase [Chengkuizengella marina]|uniref:Lysoplasmalogenase n=1 Tax=Chengkuizengella marina TaxID=2507566 RepID=A0A6N9Q818_9BACL|nr:lysoplasmalogenase [Chengkuizengella marina]NBI30890.1 lysoplasmalogenase [Chengkuizengella marina]
MYIPLTFFIAVSAAFYFYALFNNLTKWKYILKPGTTLLILMLVVVNLDQAGIYGWLICLALIFSIIGDILLMLPSDRFIQGLISFFIAHVVYVVAFPEFHEISGYSITVAILLILCTIVFALSIIPAVRREGGMLLIIAVLAYMGIITLMVYKAVISGEIILILGAISFYISDAILAWNRFIKTYPLGEFMLMFTYFLAQTFIAYSAIV